MLSDSNRKYLNWAGSALSLIAVIFVFAKLQQNASEIDLSSLTLVAWPLALLCLIYAASNCLLTFSWQSLLAYLGESITLKKATHIYGVSLIAKYLPGNVFQFVGRQALGMNAGIAAKPLLKSTFLEIVLLSVCGCLFLITLVHQLWPLVSVAVSLLFFILASALIIWFTSAYFGLPVAKATVSDLLFLMLSGAIFLAVLKLLIPTLSLTFELVTLVVASYVVAWLAGLLTPGAPAGLGIREVALLTFLSPLLGEAPLLAAIVVSRLVTVGGDLLFYSSALFLSGKAPSNA